MGLLNLAIKNGTRALGYGKRVAKVTPDFFFGENSDIIGGAMRNTKGSLFTKGKAGFKALESHVATETLKNGNFAKRVLSNLKSTPSAIKTGYKTAAAAAKAAGKNSLWAGLKGVGKTLAKKMPFISAAATVIFEAPNVIGAFKDGGFKGGMKELGGVGIELGSMAGGAAIGSAICPGVGTVVGGLIGGLVGMFARGKTHSEKKAEEEALANQQQEAPAVEYTQEEVQVLKSCGFDDETIKNLQLAGYTMQDIEKAVETELKAQEEEYAKQQEALTSTASQQQTDYDPTLGYQYNNLNSIPQTGFNNPYATLQQTPLNNTDKYANDIYYQQLFGTTPTINPFNEHLNNQYLYYNM